MINGINVVIVNDFDYIQGGASKVAIDTANILVKKSENIKVYYFSAVHKKTDVLDPKIIQITTNQKEAILNKIMGLFNGIYNLKAKRELKRLLLSLDKKRTVLHIHGWTKALSSSIFDISFKMGYKVILTMHDYFTACPNGGYFNYPQNKICHLAPLSLKCVFSNCDSRNYFFKLYRVVRQFVQNKIVKLNQRLTDVISISEFSEKILKNTLGKNVRIHRVNNPIDINNKTVNEDFNKNDYYLCVSRLSPEKGVEIFCEAMKRTNKRGIVVGDGSEKEKLQKEYPNIEFVGWKSNEEVKQYMKNAKYLVFTSKLYEGSPLTTMEALQIGLPCIVWSGCAAVDQIKEGKNGFLFSNIDDLCNVIINKKIKKFEFEYENDYCSDLISVFKKVISNEKE